MTAPLTRTQKAAKVAAAQMANRDTPFIYNEWYVAGFSEEFGRELIQRTILGKQLVFYRKERGSVVALHDRCPHRAFPLSKGMREGDSIVCAYHGIRYDDTGACVEVPATGKKHPGICVHKYPTVEQSPLVWVWMGDPILADDSTIPEIKSLAADWRCSKGYMHLEANYVYLHENLLDLTHLSFLHRNTFGTPDYATAPYDTKIDDDEISITRSVTSTTLPPVWAEPTGITGENQGARVTQTKFISPGLQLINANFFDVTLDENKRPDLQILTAHIPTPETMTSTHYFVVHGRNFATEDDSITDYMHTQLMAAFNEDVVGLGAQEKVLAASDDDFYEISVATDAPGVAMRRHLKKRSDAEHSNLENKC